MSMERSVEMLYTIQGFFFLKDDMPFVAEFSKVDEGNIMIFSSLIRNIFSGFIGPDPDIEDGLVGFMTDHYGEAHVVDVKIDERRLSFTKLYLRRSRPVYYKFNCIHKSYL